MKGYVEKMKKITLCEKTVTIKSTMKDADVTAMEELADHSECGDCAEYEVHPGRTEKDRSDQQGRSVSETCAKKLFAKDAKKILNK